MKAFARLFTVVGVLISISLPVLAAPSSDCATGVGCLNTDSELQLEQNTIEDSLVARRDDDDDPPEGLLKTAQDFIEFMEDNPNIVNRKSICFYTGGTRLAKAKTVTPTFQVMNRFSRKVGCQILQDILRRLPGSFADQDNWRTFPEWAEVSKAMARLTSKNPTYVLLGEIVNPQSIWKTVEEPVLKRHIESGKLTDVEVWTFTKKNDFVKTGNLEGDDEFNYWDSGIY